MSVVNMSYFHKRLNAQQQRTKEITASKIFAKASVMHNGSARIFVIFQLSRQAEFFFEFSAPSRRSPRRKWRYERSYIAHEGRSGDAVSFMAFLLRRRMGEVWTIRHPNGKRLTESMLEHAAHPCRSLTPLPQPGQVGMYRTFDR